jgi:hypothetical protein
VDRRRDRGGARGRVGSLNAYLDRCLEIIALFDNFTVQHVSRDENTVANDLAHQASCF